MSTPETEPPRYAFLGVRGCELAAMKIQDKVFMGGPYVDPTYQKRRAAAFVVAVNASKGSGLFDMSLIWERIKGVKRIKGVRPL